MSESQRLSAQRLKEIRAELAECWPLIGRWLHTDRKHGLIDFDGFGWFEHVRRHDVRGEVLAVAYEQQAGYYGWYLEHQVGELAADAGRYRLVARWTDSMTYLCQRLATRARGEDPGEWVPQDERRPDLDAPIVAAIVAEPDADGDRGRQLVGAGVDR